ncbi:hypothetical protein ACIQ1J_09780 [Streptomyces sp. NPDC097107]|uniref:hypothetical protein n=1 Tax=Streptomyces sp. NPDC097107 TaxID=3366089 RepID=UPI00382B7E1E
MVQESFLDPFRGGGAGEDVGAAAVLQGHQAAGDEAAGGGGTELAAVRALVADTLIQVRLLGDEGPLPCAGRLAAEGDGEQLVQEAAGRLGLAREGGTEAMQAASRAQAVGAASTASRRRRTYVPVPCSITATGRSLMSG